MLVFKLLYGLSLDSVMVRPYCSRSIPSSAISWSAGGSTFCAQELCLRTLNSHLANLDLSCWKIVEIIYVYFISIDIWTDDLISVLIVLLGVLSILSN